MSSLEWIVIVGKQGRTAVKKLSEMRLEDSCPILAGIVKSYTDIEELMPEGFFLIRPSGDSNLRVLFTPFFGNGQWKNEYYDVNWEEVLSGNS